MNPSRARATRELHAAILEDLKDPSITYRRIALRHGCTEATVGLVARANGLLRRKKQKSSQ
jgi:transposase-like protein